MSARSSVSKPFKVATPCLAGLFLVASATSTPALAQAKAKVEPDYPSRPIRLLVPISAGGGADISTRLVATRLTDALGQQVVVDNRPGGSGNIALGTLANSTPNGYTMALLTTTHSINWSLHKNLPYDVMRDFVGVSQLTAQPYCLSVNPKVPATTVMELVELARARPGTLTYGSSGIGSLSHLAGELLARLGRFKWIHVPYKGGVLGINDAIAGNISSQFTTIIGTQAHVKAGRLRWLAISSPQRSRAAPNLPTVSEAGLPNFAAVGFYGVVMRAGTPQPIVDKVSREIAKILQSPEVGGRFALDGSEPVGSTSKEFTDYFKGEAKRYAALTKELGMRSE